MHSCLRKWCSVFNADVSCFSYTAASWPANFLLWENSEKEGGIFDLCSGEGEDLNPEVQTSCKQNSSSSKYIIRNPLFEPFKKLMITTTKIREANTVLQETRIFSMLSITGKAEAGIFFTNTYTDFEKYKSYLTLMVFKISFFTMSNDAYEVR